MKSLNLGDYYTREDVSKIFNSHTRFTRGSGTWGLHGIVPLKDREGDYIFFVTLKNNEHKGKYKEGISTNGLLTWHSQLKKDINHKYTQHFINHNPLINNIHLFYRENKNSSYAYMGRLGYISHDTNSQPIFFIWHLLDWNQFNINKLKDLSKKYNFIDNHEKKETSNSLIKTNPPNSKTNQGKNFNSFIPKHIDFDELNIKNKELGNAGEELVISYLCETLISQGKKDLAESIFHTAKYEGDGAGYDIKARDPNGKDIFIEVKTSTGSINSNFFLSKNELEFSKLKNEQYYLYRIYDYDIFNNSGKFYIINGDLYNKLDLTPTVFKAKFKS